MLLRSFITKAKKALYSFKSFFSACGYERLQKTSAFSPLDINELDRVVHHQFCEHRQGVSTASTSSIVKEEYKEIKNKVPMRKYGSFREGNELYNGSSIRERQAHEPNKEEERRYGSLRSEKGREIMLCSPRRKKVRFESRVEYQRLKELELRLKELEQMDACNVEHVLDIEEVLHYYSRITCPSYIHIFNKFFMEVYVESLAQSSKLVFGHPRRIS